MFAGEDTAIAVIIPSQHNRKTSKDQVEEFIEFNLAEEEKAVQPIFMSASLSAELKLSLLNLLKEFYGHTLDART